MRSRELVLLLGDPMTTGTSAGGSPWTRRSIGLVIGLSFAFFATTLTAEAEPVPKVYRVGYLALGLSPTPPASYQSLDAFRLTLHNLGYAEGRNLVIEYRWGEQKSETLPALAAELASLQVDLIFVPDTPSARAAKNATKTIPIVVMIFDPVGSGLVASLNQPGGNVTGMSVMGIELWPKRLEMLRETVPGVFHVAGVYFPGPPSATRSLIDSFIRETDAAAKELGVRLTSIELGGDRTEWDQAFEAMARDGITALLLVQNPVYFANRAYLAELAIKHRLPTMYQAREYVEAGGLMAYGANIDDVSRHAAIYADKILKGAKPADLPLRGRLDLEDTIKRLKAYEAAGADALMAPGLPDLEAVRAVCSAVGKPFNFMVGIKGKSFTVAALAAAGVKRISLATSLYRAAMTGLLSAAKEVREHGTFGYIDTSLATPDMNAFLRE